MKKVLISIILVAFIGSCFSSIQAVKQHFKIHKVSDHDTPTGPVSHEPPGK